MSRQFTQKVQMPCTAAQYRIIHPDLRKLGYDCLEPGGPEGMKMVYVSNGTVSWNHKLLKQMGFTPIDTFSPVLFLALAACSDSEFGGLGEYWKCNEGYDNQFTEGHIYRQESVDLSETKSFIDDIGVLNGFIAKGYSNNFTRFRKATLSEIVPVLFYKDKIYNEKGFEIGVRGPKSDPECAGIPDEAPRKGGWNETHDGIEFDPDDIAQWQGPTAEDRDAGRTIYFGNPITNEEAKKLFELLHKLRETQNVVNPVKSEESSFFDQVLIGCDENADYSDEIAQHEKEADSATEKRFDFHEIQMDIEKHLENLEKILSKHGAKIEYSTPDNIPTRNEWEKARIKMLWGAISAYVREEITLPDPWVNEFAELLHKRAEDLPF